MIFHFGISRRFPLGRDRFDYSIINSPYAVDIPEALLSYSVSCTKSHEDNKTIYLPYEATGILSAIGGIKDLLESAGKLGGRPECTGTVPPDV